MNTEHLNPELEEVAQHLERDDEFRVLRALPQPYATLPENGSPPAGRCVAIVDLETSGLDPARDAIIELAIMLVYVDDDGAVSGHVGPLCWLEDPQVPLEPQITWITGLSNEQLAGQRIPDESVLGLLDRADLVVAHNCAFEISWLERRYPQLADKPWACSMRDIPWLELGLDGRAQTALLNQHGWFSIAHRAGPDVWALFCLLQESRTGWLKGPKKTHLQRLLKRQIARPLWSKPETHRSMPRIA